MGRAVVKPFDRAGFSRDTAIYRPLLRWRRRRRSWAYLLLSAVCACYLLSSLVHGLNINDGPNNEHQYSFPSIDYDVDTDVPSQDGLKAARHSLTPTPISVPVWTPTPTPEPPKSPNAIAIFLTAKHDEKQEDEDESDWYYMGARTLVYQLLHAPKTKLTKPIPVIVLATPEVRQSKRKQLEQDGATVVVAEDVPHDFYIPVPRYQQVFAKFRLFDPKVMPYKKVLMLDTDMVITRNIEAIFNDDASRTRFVQRNNTNAMEFEFATPPRTYLFAATPDPGIQSMGHQYPFLDPDRTAKEANVGCMLFSPSTEIYNYYLAILSHPDLFDHSYPEQAMLNFVHRLDGPMPWQRLHHSWALVHPNQNDIDGGMAILHAKFWEHVIDYGPAQKYALARRWEMQGYWMGLGAQRDRT